MFGCRPNVEVERPAAEPSGRAVDSADYSLDKLARSALYSSRSAPTIVRTHAVVANTKANAAKIIADPATAKGSRTRRRRCSVQTNAPKITSHPTPRAEPASTSEFLNSHIANAAGANEASSATTIILSPSNVNHQHLTKPPSLRMSSNAKSSGRPPRPKHRAAGRWMLFGYGFARSALYPSRSAPT